MTNHIRKIRWSRYIQSSAEDPQHSSEQHKKNGHWYSIILESQSLYLAPLHHYKEPRFPLTPHFHHFRPPLCPPRRPRFRQERRGHSLPSPCALPCARAGESWWTPCRTGDTGTSSTGCRGRRGGWRSASSTRSRWRTPCRTRGTGAWNDPLERDDKK